MSSLLHLNNGKPFTAAELLPDSIKIAFLGINPGIITEQRALSWDELSELLSNPEINDSKEGKAWMPADIPVGARKADRVISVGLLVLDIEANAERIDGVKTIVGKEPPTMFDIKYALTLDHDLKVIGHTSYSHHDPDLPPVDVVHERYRLVFALSRPMIPAEVKPLALHVAGMLGLAHCVDHSCMEAARLYYLPRCPAERKDHFQHFTTDGEPLDVDKLLAEIPVEQKPLNLAPVTAYSRDVISLQDVADLPRARSALMSFDANLDYHEWINMGMAIKDAGLTFDDFDQWSKTGSNYNSREFNHKKWNSFEIGGGITEATIFKKARDNGWVDSYNEATGSPLSDFNHVGDTFISTTPEKLPELPPVRPFDYEYLPQVVRAFVSDIAERSQCAPDYVAVSTLVMLSSLIGRKMAIRPKANDNWAIIPNLWGAVVGKSGSNKSHSISSALRPIYALEKNAKETHKRAMVDYEEDSFRATVKAKANKDAKTKALKADPDADLSGFKTTTDEPTAPKMKRYVVGDITYEKLADLMVENPNGLLSSADELISVLKRLDKQGQEEARGFYLTGADGDKGYSVDRIIRGSTYIDAVCLSIIGGIQPSVLSEYVRQATSNGAGADGLLQRFGLMVYPDLDKGFTYIDRSPDRDAYNEMADFVSYLDEKMENLVGGEVDQYENTTQFLRFDAAAQSVFIEWYTALQIRLRSGEDHEAMASHISKYASLIPALALIFHLCDRQKNNTAGFGASVGEEHLLKAIAFSDYLESHAQRIYSYATRPDLGAAKTLLKRLDSGKVDMPFKARDIYIKGWTGLETAAQAQAAIDLLVEYSHLTEHEINTGGRPTRVYIQNKGAL